jgi:RNA-dependent RNA polymerase
MADFFVTFMKNDSLGRIAHAHLAQADQEVNGVQSDVCLELAKLHSQAVDYPKSGIPAVMNDEVRPKKWPHFMEKKFVQKRQIYTSKHILGQLYDRVQLVDFKPQWENPFDKRILNAFQLEETLLSQAADVKIVYDESLKRLMAKHGLRTEFEAWSVFVLAHSKDSNDYKFAEEFGRAIDALKSHFRDICRTTARAESPSDWSKMGPFVAAMYTTTAREMEEALKGCRMFKPIGGQDIPLRKMDVENMPLISFPWLFVRELGKIATGCATLQLEPQKATHHTHRSRKQTKVASEVPIEASTVETEAGITHFGEPLALDFGPLHSISTPDVPSTTGFNKIRREAAADESLQQSSLAHKLPSTIISFAESNKPFIPASLTTTKPHTWTPKPRNPHSEEVREEDNISQLPIRSHTHVEETTQNEGTMQTEGTTRTEGIPENDLSFAIEIDHSKPSRLDRLMQIGRG